MRIVSYNIHKGFDLFRNYILPEMREALLDLSPDVVFLQEVKGLHGEFENQFLTLASDRWPYQVYVKNNHIASDHYGNAIMSRWPIESFEYLDITNHLLEKRSLLSAWIQRDQNERPFPVTTVHLDLTHTGRVRQLQKIEEYILRNFGAEGPFILAGDFNDWHGRLSRVFSQDLNLFDAYRRVHGRHAQTFPSQLPFLPLDRIYLRGFRVKKVQVLRGRPWNNLSDHLPLYAEIEISSTGLAGE